MKRIETMRCEFPILFWMGWGAIVLWMLMATTNYLFGYTLIYQWILDGWGFFMFFMGMFAMFCSLDWSEVESFFFVRHPGRLRKIGYDYVFMFICFWALSLIEVELVRNILVMFSLGMYLYDMLKLAEMHVEGKDNKLLSWQQFVMTLKSLVSPKERLGRKGFLIIFFCAIMALFVFAVIASRLWFLYDPFPDFRFNMCLSLTFFGGCFALVSGLWPLVLFLLYSATSVSFLWRHEMGYWFLTEAIIVDLLYVLYIIQCIRRCRDLGKKWYWCCIPLFNPFALLFHKSDSTNS